MKAKTSIYQRIGQAAGDSRKLFAVLVDPDKAEPESLQRLVQNAAMSRVDFFFVGGSLMNDGELESTILTIKSLTDIPVILFPGSPLQINKHADAILFLSLISGRNPELLIGNHVIAAPYIKAAQLEVLSTGYMLVDSGRATTASYISNTAPIPYDKPDIAACTAMAGEFLGMRLIYLDGGSGAEKPLSPEMIAKVKKSIDIPLIVGGGINTPEKAEAAYRAGADLLVVGNALEKNADLLSAMADVRRSFHNSGVSR